MYTSLLHYIYNRCRDTKASEAAEVSEIASAPATVAGGDTDPDIDPMMLRYMKMVQEKKQDNDHDDDLADKLSHTPSAVAAPTPMSHDRRDEDAAADSFFGFEKNSHPNSDGLEE